MPCVDKPVVYEIVSSCFSKSVVGKLHIVKGSAIVHPLVFRNYLSFACTFCSGMIGKCLTELKKWSVLISDLNPIYQSTAHNMLAYCLVVMGEYREAAHHVMLSLDISTEYSNVAVHFLQVALDVCMNEDPLPARSHATGTYTRTACTNTVVLDCMVQRLDQAELGNYADIIRQHVVSGHINDLYQHLHWQH
jgi:hypothetical protein